MQFNLTYYTSITIADFNENDIKDNEWFISRLAKQKEDEIEAKKKKYGVR